MLEAGLEVEVSSGLGAGLELTSRVFEASTTAACTLAASAAAAAFRSATSIGEIWGDIGGIWGGIGEI